MTVFKDRLSQGRFIITAEFDPPRGPRVKEKIDQATKLAERVDALNITDSPMARLRMNPIAFAAVLQRETGLETIFHLTCRDRSLLGLQADLLGAHALGLRNFLALTGDSPSNGRRPATKAVFQTDSRGLIELAGCLNGGVDLWSESLEDRTEFFIGTAVNPDADDLGKEVHRLAGKVESGAAFAQTQPVFDLRGVEGFLRAAEDIPVPIIFGLMPLKSLRQAQYLNNNVPGITVPDWILDRLAAGDEGEGVRIAGELMATIAPLVDGIHLFPMGNEQVVLDLTRDFQRPSPRGQRRTPACGGGQQDDCGEIA